MLMEGLWLRVHGIGRLFSDPQTSRNESAQYVSCGNSASLVNYLGLFAHPREKVQFKTPDAIFAMVHRKLPSPFCACTGSAYGPSARTLVSQKSQVGVDPVVHQNFAASGCVTLIAGTSCFTRLL